MMQERARRTADQHLRSRPHDGNLIQRFHRAVRLAGRGAKRGEVMPSDENLRRVMHGAGVEGLDDLPRAAGVQRQRRAPVDNAVFVSAPDARKTGVKIIPRRLGGENGDRQGL